MDLNISKIINFFFKRVDIFEFLEDDFDKKIKELFSSTFDELKGKYNEWKNYPIIQEKLNELSTNTSNLEVYKIGFTIIQDFLHDEAIRKLILKILEIFLYNIEEILFATPIIDNSLYNSLSKFIKSIAKTEIEKGKELFYSFGKDFEKKISFFLIVNTISIFQEKKDIENILENANENEYQKYMSDWTIKYAQIIEGPLKNALVFLLKLKYISQKKNCNYLNNQHLSIGSVLNKLNIDKILANYRNAIFHQTIYLTKEPKTKDKKIIFTDREKEFTLTLEEYTNEYYKVFIFLITFYLVGLKVYIDLFKQPDQIINKILFHIDEFMEEIVLTTYEDFLLNLQNNLKN